MSFLDMGKSRSNKDDTKSSKQAERLKRKELKTARQNIKTYDSPEERRFTDELGQLGLVVKVMEADGNCLFRALSDQVTGTSKQHFEIRRQIIDYIESHKEHYSLFIEDDEPFDDYISRMRETGEWGGHQELHAASQSLQINIYVHQVDAPRYILTCKDATMDIHLSYHGECHYNSVRSKKDPDNGDKPIPIDVEEIKKFIMQKEAQIEAQKERESQTKNEPTPDDASFVFAGWISPDIVQFVKDSYDAFEDVYEEALEMASSLTTAETPAPAVINGKAVPARSRSVSRREARKAQQEPPKPMSKKEARKAAKEQTSKEETESKETVEAVPITRTVSLGIEI